MSSGQGACLLELDAHALERVALAAQLLAVQLQLRVLLREPRLQRQRGVSLVVRAATAHAIAQHFNKLLHWKQAAYRG